MLQRLYDDMTLEVIREIMFVGVGVFSLKNAMGATRLTQNTPNTYTECVITQFEHFVEIELCQNWCFGHLYLHHMKVIFMFRRPSKFTSF